VNRNDYGWILFCSALITFGVVVGVAFCTYLHWT